MFLQNHSTHLFDQGRSVRFRLLFSTRPQAWSMRALPIRSSAIVSICVSHDNFDEYQLYEGTLPSDRVVASHRKGTQLVQKFFFLSILIISALSSEVYSFLTDIQCS